MKPIILHGISTNVNCGPIAPAASTSLRTAQAPQTGYAHLAVPEHIPPLPTKIHVHRGQIAAPAITSLRTEPIYLTVYAHFAVPEHIPLPPTHSLAPLGPIA